MRNLITVYPDADLAELEAQLAAALQSCGQQVLERLDHPRGQVFPALSGALARHPGAHAYICFEPEPIGIEAPTSVVHRYGAPPTRWDMSLERALSQALGGWASSLLSDRQRDDYGTAVIYAGCAVEHVHWSAGEARQRLGVPLDAPRLDEEGSWVRFIAQHRAIGGGHESDLRWSDRVNVHSWIVQQTAEPVPAESGSGRVRRAMFIDVRAAQWQAALAQGGPEARSVRYLERAAPLTQTPCLLLDGEFDDAWFTALAWQLAAHASAVELDGSDGRFTWCEVRTDRSVHAGMDQGALALAKRWGALTLMLGEPPSIVRWPSHP